VYESDVICELEIYVNYVYVGLNSHSHRLVLIW
jgi:hypothetical protein